jgi:serine/threonine protein kinase
MTLGYAVDEGQLISEEETTKVYLAYDLDNQMKVVLKVPKRHCHQTRNEAEILPMLDHPNIIKLRGVHDTENGPLIVMDRALDGDLFSHLD